MTARAKYLDRGEAVNLVFNLREYGSRARAQITLHGLFILFDAIECMDAELKRLYEERDHPDAMLAAKELADEANGNGNDWNAWCKPRLEQIRAALASPPKAPTPAEIMVLAKKFTEEGCWPEQITRYEMIRALSAFGIVVAQYGGSK